MSSAKLVGSCWFSMVFQVPFPSTCNGPCKSLIEACSRDVDIGIRLVSDSGIWYSLCGLQLARESKLQSACLRITWLKNGWHICTKIDKMWKILVQFCVCAPGILTHPTVWKGRGIGNWHFHTAHYETVIIISSWTPPAQGLLQQEPSQRLPMRPGKDMAGLFPDLGACSATQSQNWRVFYGLWKALHLATWNKNEQTLTIASV